MKKPSDVFKQIRMQEEKKDKFDIGEYDQEGDMAKSDLRSIVSNAQKLHDMIDDADNLPEWVQSKITKAEDYISTVANYMTSEMSEEVTTSKPKTDHDKWKQEYKKARDAGSSSSNAKARANGAVYEEVEQIDEVSLKTASSAYAKRIGQNKPSSQSKAVQTIRQIAKKHGASGVATAAKTAEKEALKKFQQEEVELHELTGKGQLPKIAAYHKQKGDDAKGRMETIRNTNRQVPVPKEKSAKIYAKDAESTYHYTQAKRAKALMAKEETELDEGMMKRMATDKEEDNRMSKVPFEGPYTKVKNTVTDKSGAKHSPMSRARDLARTAMKKQADKMKVPVKKDLKESRKSEIVKEIMKKKKDPKDKFEPNPTLTSQVQKIDNAVT